MRMRLEHKSKNCSSWSLTLSGAHFSAAPTPDMKVSVKLLGSLITNLKSDFQNSKWRIQYGGQNFKKLAYKHYNLYIWLYGIADYESEVGFSKYKKADSIWRTKF